MAIHIPRNKWEASWSHELSSQSHDSWTMLNGMSGIQNHQATPSMFYLHKGNLLSMDVGFYLDVYLDHNWNG